MKKEERQVINSLGYKEQVILKHLILVDQVKDTAETLTLV